MAAAALERSVLRMPGLGRLRRAGWLNAWLRRGWGPHWGRFATREEALAFLRPSGRVAYDDDRIAEINIDALSEVHLFDWPVLYFLRTATTGRLRFVVTDFGGHVGVKFKAYRPHLGSMTDLSWQVVDVPAICREGRRRMHELPSGLGFFETPEATAACDLLLLSGVMPYVEESVGEIVGRLPQRPRSVLLNKVAITDGDPFYTLESFGLGRMPYRVLSETRIDEERETLGYRLAARWRIPDRDLDVPHARGTARVRMIGEAWTD